MAGVCGRRISK